MLKSLRSTTVVVAVLGAAIGSSIIVLGQAVEANIQKETETEKMMELNRHHTEIEMIYETGL